MEQRSPLCFLTIWRGNPSRNNCQVKKNDWWTDGEKVIRGGLTAWCLSCSDDGGPDGEGPPTSAAEGSSTWSEAHLHQLQSAWWLLLPWWPPMYPVLCRCGSQLWLCPQADTGLVCLQVSGTEFHLDRDMKTLHFYSVEDGDQVVVRWPWPTNVLSESELSGFRTTKCPWGKPVQTLVV